MSQLQDFTQTQQSRALVHNCMTHDVATNRLTLKARDIRARANHVRGLKLVQTRVLFLLPYVVLIDSLHYARTCLTYLSFQQKLFDALCIIFNASPVKH